MSGGPISPLRLVGRCELFDEIGSGGMATVHLGRLAAAGGFSKIVAIKRMHEALVKDPEFVAMFLDEARLIARIKHPNVRPTLDLIEEDGELFIVMEYVAGVSLRRLFDVMVERGEPMPPEIAAHILAGVLHGLEAAHNATDANGRSLLLVHRDVSPENILVGSDGMSRLLDFGMAKALGRLHLTQPGLVKGKLTVMAPEQVQGREVSRRTDVFACGVVLWQALTGRRLIEGNHIGEVAHNVVHQKLEPPSSVVDWLPPRLDRVVMKAIERDPEDRWESAEAMAVALEGALKLATQHEVSDWLREVAGQELREREALVAAVERSPIGAPLEARTSGAGTSGVRSYTWMSSAMGSAKKALDEARAELAEVVAQEEPVPVKMRSVVTRFPRASIAAGLGLVVLASSFVIAFSGDAEPPVESESTERQDPAARRKSKPDTRGPSSASSSGKPAAPPVPWVVVPAGEVIFGCNTWADRLCGPDEMPPSKVHLDAFEISRTEVTVGEYRACVDAGACNVAHLDSHGIEEIKLERIDKCNYGRDGRRHHPINCVSHQQAAAYCAHVGGRLPTEAEWERAAGGPDAWPYPTGEASINCERAVMSENGDGCGRGTTWPVGEKATGASPEGAMDMAGNVAEWVADLYQPTHRGVADRNPTGPTDGTMHVVRGGSWRDSAARLLRSSARSKRPTGTHAIDLGFRCVRKAP